jgi:transposase
MDAHFLKRNQSAKVAVAYDHSNRKGGGVPKQHSSGGKQNLLGISKRGDTYLRTLMIHGARAVIRFADNKAEPESGLRKLSALITHRQPLLPECNQGG